MCRRARPSAPPPIRTRRDGAADAGGPSWSRAAALGASTASSARYLDLERRSSRTGRGRSTALADEVAASLIQQRERLLDLSDEMLQAMRRRALSARTRHAEDWDSTRSPRRSRSTSTPARASTSAVLEPRRWSRSCGREIETVIEAREAELVAAAPAVLRAPLLPRGDRRAVDRAPQDDGCAARGHRPARLRPEGPEAGVQEGRLRRCSAR